MAKKDPAGTGLALGLSLGLVIGAALGVANDNPGLWIALGIALGLVFGMSYDEQQKNKKKRHADVKIIDGAGYTLLRRTDPQPGQRHHCWVGDNGSELELTDEEASERGLD